MYSYYHKHSGPEVIRNNQKVPYAIRVEGLASVNPKLNTTTSSTLWNAYVRVMTNFHSHYKAVFYHDIDIHPKFDY